MLIYVNPVTGDYLGSDIFFIGWKWWAVMYAGLLGCIFLLVLVARFMGSNNGTPPPTLSPSPSPECSPGANPFPINATGQCQGLQHDPAGDNSAEDCAQSCCADAECLVWQWQPLPDEGCYSDQSGDCDPNSDHGWQGGRRVCPANDLSWSPAYVICSACRVNSSMVYFVFGAVLRPAAPNVCTCNGQGICRSAKQVSPAYIANHTIDWTRFGCTPTPPPTPSIWHSSDGPPAGGAVLCTLAVFLFLSMLA